jgi:hypothetical protein
MRKLKKFADGDSVTNKFFDWMTDKDTRSVMDIPEKDMRDPQYRKELGEKQALETSSPEFALIGPARASAAVKTASTEGRGVAKSFLDELSPAPAPKRIPEIGEKLPSKIHRQTIEATKKFEDDFEAKFKKRPKHTKEDLRSATKDKIQENREAANIPDEATRRARKVQRIKDDIAKQAMSGTAFGLKDAVNSNKEDKGYQKGGKISTAVKNPKHKNSW